MVGVSCWLRGGRVYLVSYLVGVSCYSSCMVEGAEEMVGERGRGHRDGGREGEGTQIDSM